MPAEDLPISFHATAAPSSLRTRSHSQNPDADHLKSNRNLGVSGRNRTDDQISYSSAGHEQPAMSRSASVARRKGGDNGPAVLKKRLSQRKANAIAREQQIRLMASTPIDIPYRSPRLADPLAAGRQRGVSRGRRSDRYLSDVSLSMRESSNSSMTDISETYKFKVNAFAALTPRPVVRYVQPRVQTARSQNASAASVQKERLPALPMSEENLYTKKRIDKLADDLDAGALRELLERDRRRTEKQQVDDQEKLRRKLERKAERQRKEEERAQENPSQGPPDVPNGRPDNESPEVNATDENVLRDSQAKDAEAAEQPASLPGDASKGTQQIVNGSVESVHVVGTIDDRSIDEQNFSQRQSFAPSQDMRMSQSSFSVRHELSSPTSSQIYPMSRTSTSDVSRAVESERRLSDLSSKHANTFSSLFRRGSSRLKRRYRERFREPASNLPNPSSHESFFKTSTPSSAPPSFIPPRAFLGSGTIKRQHSKFIEHLGDEPVSMPASRLQSPEIPEETSDQDEASDVPVDTSNRHDDTQVQNGVGGRARSLVTDSVEVEPEAIPLSQSLASIDSEGSWMSGQFLRSISKRTTNHKQHSMDSLGDKLDKHARSGPAEGESELLVESAPSREEAHDTVLDARKASSNVISQHDQDNDTTCVPEEDETWHGQIAKRPVLVTPTVRPKSNAGILKDPQSSPISADEGSSPIEPMSAEFDHALGADVDGEHAN